MTLKDFKEATKDLPEDAEIIISPSYEYPFLTKILEVQYEPKPNKIIVLC